MNRFCLGFKACMVLGASLLFASNTFAVDACKETMGHSGNGTTVSSNGSGAVGSSGLNYEIWFQGGSNSMTYYNNGTFSAKWSGSSDFLARVGLKYNSDKTHSQIGYFTADYSYTKTGSAQYGYIGIYGWTKNPEVEYYIVDDWFSKPSTQYLGTKMGELTVDGGTYDIYTYTRVQQPSISGTSTFPQFFSVRRTPRTCGHIDISAHFKKWDELFHGQSGNSGVTLKLGNLYEVKLLTEAGGNATGTVDYSYLAITSDGTAGSGTTGSSASAEVSSSSAQQVAQTPYKGAIAVPGVVEAENYDVGGQNNAYYDSDDTNEGNATYRTGDGVDIVSLGDGYAVGYTTAGEWLEYTVNVGSDGVYDFVLKASNGGSAANTVSMTLDNAAIATAEIPNGKDWDTYTEVSSTTSSIKAGAHILRVTFDDASTNLDKITFSKQGTETILTDYSGLRGSRNYQVFDLQGRLLGWISVNKGASVSIAVGAKFHRAGLYVVKDGGALRTISVK